MSTAAYVTAVLIGLLILGHVALAVFTWRVRRAKAARLRRRLWDVGMEIQAERDAALDAMEQAVNGGEPR